MKYSESQMFEVSRRGWIVLVVVAIAVLAAFFLTAPAKAAQSLIVTSGGESGSYFRFVKEVAGVCPEVGIDNRASTGSVMNLDRLEANEASVGFVQLDVLSLYGNSRPMDNYKVLLPVFPEQVHVFTRSNLGKKEGGYGIGALKFGGKDVVLNTMSDLMGRTVASAGGSYITAQVIRLQSEMQFTLTELKSADEVIQAVASGQYDAGILVGAQPLGAFDKLGEGLTQLKLLPVTPELETKLSRVYSKGVPLNYRKMGPGGTSVVALAVPAALVTQNYKAATMVQKVVALRECILANAEEVAATPGKHPAWRYIKADAVSKWPVYEAPGQTQTLRKVK